RYGLQEPSRVAWSSVVDRSREDGLKEIAEATLCQMHTDDAKYTVLARGLRGAYAVGQAIDQRGISDGFECCFCRMLFGESFSIAFGGGHIQLHSPLSHSTRAELPLELHTRDPQVDAAQRGAELRRIGRALTNGMHQLQ